MIVPVPLHALLHQVRHLAQATRAELRQAQIALDDWRRVAHYYGLTLGWEDLPAPQLGCYLLAAQRILLNPRRQGRERRRFTFYHELMHHRIEHDDEVLSLFADVTPAADEALMERLCDVGAAELLLPTEDVQRMVQQHGLSPATIPLLCDCYQASSIAAALQMVHTAPSPCYLVIAGPPGATYVGRGTRRVGLSRVEEGPRLVMQYTAASPEARYTIQRGQPVPVDHPITAAWAHAGTVVRAQVPLPFARGRGWGVPCEALAFRRRVFAVFYVGLGERAS